MRMRITMLTTKQWKSVLTTSSAVSNFRGSRVSMYVSLSSLVTGGDSSGGGNVLSGSTLEERSSSTTNSDWTYKKISGQQSRDYVTRTLLFL